MSTRALRVAVPLALLTVGAGVLAPAPTATAASTVETAAAAFGLSDYTVVEIKSTGDITDALTTAAKSSGTVQPTLIHLQSGDFKLTDTVRPASNVYLVAEADSRITWAGASGQTVVRFGPVNSGAYGGIWDGNSKANTVITADDAQLQLVGLTVSNGTNHGLAAYRGAVLQLQNLTATSNDIDGVHVEGSVLEATGLTATSNRRNGLQLSDNSVGTITNSKLESNGQAVSGTTDGKTGHGLGLAAATATVSNTSISNNKVCGVSLVQNASVKISGSSLNRNGRHGLGTVPGVSAVISDSTINNSGHHGVLSSGSGASVKLERVSINSSKQAGVSVPAGGSASISGSTISGSGAQGISVSRKGSLLLLAGNTITKAKENGIAISERASLRVTGAGNVISNNRKNGLLLIHSGSKGTITAPISFVNNKKYHVQVTVKAKLVTVKSSFTGTGGTGVFKNRGGKVTITN